MSTTGFLVTAGTLPDTGAGGWLVLLGAGLIVTGTVLSLIARRRRTRG